MNRGGLWTGRIGRTRLVVVASVILPLLATASCSTGGGAQSGQSPRPAGQASGVLNYDFIGPPLGLQPAKNDSKDSAVFTSLDYDPLIYQAPDGSFQPDLATSWRYVGSGNRAFQVTLRRGVLFQDGTTMDANAVKASMDYYLSVRDRPFEATTAALSTVQVVDPMTVQINLSQPVPDMPLVLSQQYEVGDIIGPEGLANPASLDNHSDGAGPYTLNWSESVTNDHYTYVRNVNYWNESAGHYQKIVVHILSQPQAVLSSLQTGQLDFAPGSPRTAQAAKNAGLTVMSAPFTSFGLLLLDRSGTLSKPLRDVRVRQAINYAIDRNSIAKALYGTYAKPTDEPLGNIGSDAYVPSLNNYYSYNPGKARQLLAEAGYPHGFTLPVLTESILDQNDQLAQAIASYLGKVGITMQMTNIAASMSVFGNDQLSKRYPAVVFSAGAGVDGYQGGLNILPTTGIGGNAFGTTDAQVDAWFDQANASSDPGARARLYQQINRRLVQLAWFAPVCQLMNLYFFRSSLKNVRVSTGSPTPLPTAPVSSMGWYSAGAS